MVIESAAPAIAPVRGNGEAQPSMQVDLGDLTQIETNGDKLEAWMKAARESQPPRQGRPRPPRVPYQPVDEGPLLQVETHKQA